jgi:hypothetical protein
VVFGWGYDLEARGDWGLSCLGGAHVDNNIGLLLLIYEVEVNANVTKEWFHGLEFIGEVLVLVYDLHELAKGVVWGDAQGTVNWGVYPEGFSAREGRECAFVRGNFKSFRGE